MHHVRELVPIVSKKLTYGADEQTIFIAKILED